MARKALLLTSWYFPLKIVRWEDAITMLYLGKVDSVVDYDEEIRSPSTAMKVPAVIRLRRNIGTKKRGVKFSRVNVFTRDGYRCQYCNERMSGAKLTYDHVRPRCAGGRTVWTNIVTACRPCNAEKGHRTTDEAGMFPRTRPVRPKSLPLTGPRIDVETAPTEWLDFLVARV